MSRLLSKKLAFGFIVGALFSVQSSVATADMFNWSYTGVIKSGPDFDPDSPTNFSGSGTFTAHSIGGGDFALDAITGIANGFTISGLNNIYSAPSNKIRFTSDTFLDFNGVAFNVSIGLNTTEAFNFYFNNFSTGTPGGSFYDCGVAGYCMIGPGQVGNVTPNENPADPYASLTTFSVTAAVPEPSTWATMILGFVGIGAMTYRRRKTAALSA
jgi:hypothetical protein